jgi:hypothetical protein
MNGQGFTRDAGESRRDRQQRDQEQIDEQMDLYRRRLGNEFFPAQLCSVGTPSDIPCDRNIGTAGRAGTVSG